MMLRVFGPQLRMLWLLCFILLINGEVEPEDEKKIRVAVLVPSSPMMHYTLKTIGMDNVRRLPAGNPKLTLKIFVDSGPLPVLPDDERPLSKTARLRNRMLDSLNYDDWDYVLWIDSDIVEFPVDLPTRLIMDNPNGVTAPVVLIEEPGPLGPNQFYDTTAFVLKGRANYMPDVTTPYVEGRSVQLFYPWVPLQPYLAENQELVDMDGVGTVYSVPIQLFKEHGARYVDHPRLTEHWSISSAAHAHNMSVRMHTGVIVRHANLPKYGDGWHANARKPEKKSEEASTEETE